MRNAALTALVLLLVSTVFCFWSVGYIDEATDELTDLAMQLMDAADAERLPEAKEKLVMMLNRWEKYRPVLEMLSDHEDLHQVTENLVNAQVHLRFDARNDFYQCMALLNESLEHIRESEGFSWANIF